MRALSLTLILALGAPAVGAAQVRSVPLHTPRRITDTRYADLLANGTYVTTADVPGKQPSDYTIRLWSVVADGACVEGTEAICSADYYLTFQWQGEGIDPMVFALGSYGELKLLSVSNSAKDGISFVAEVSNVPADATPLAPGWVRHTRRITIHYAEDSQGVGSLTVTPVP